MGKMLTLHIKVRGEAGGEVGLCNLLVVPPGNPVNTGASAETQSPPLPVAD